MGELLPLRLSGTDERFLALNILRDVDCLNPEAYRIDDLEIYTDVEIFYLERSDDEETLRDTIERHGFRGLRFNPVWANDGSIKPMNLLGLW